MILDSINIENLRSINKFNMTFKPGINLIYGENGRGKTSILEAIYILSISRSFRSHFLRNIITDGKSNIQIVGKIKDSSNQYLKIEYYKLNNQKRIKINEKKINNLSELLGIFPVTVLSPDDIDIITGNNKDKHKFFNMILCHTNKLYLNYLQQYKLIIKQRNSLLQSQPTLEDIQIWNEKLSDLGEKIWKIRKDFFSNFTSIFTKLWNQLDCKFKANIEYHNNQILSKNEYYEQLCSNHLNDLKTGYTKKGPHKDIINLFFNNMPIKECGSQGEKKLFLIVLKISEAIYINNIMNKEPIILLDDLFAMLDKNRGSKILKLLTNNFQIFITTTDANAETYFSKMTQLNFIKLEECNDICFAA